MAIENIGIFKAVCDRCHTALAYEEEFDLNLFGGRDNAENAMKVAGWKIINGDVVCCYCLEEEAKDD